MTSSIKPEAHNANAEQCSVVVLDTQRADQETISQCCAAQKKSMDCKSILIHCGLSLTYTFFTVTATILLLIRMH